MSSTSTKNSWNSDRCVREATTHKLGKDQAKSIKSIETLQRLEITLEAKRIRAKERFISQVRYEKNELYLTTPTCVPFVLAFWYQVLSCSTTLISASTCLEKRKRGKHDQCLRCTKEATAAEAMKARKLLRERHAAIEAGKNFGKESAKAQAKEAARKEAKKENVILEGLHPDARKAYKQAKREGKLEAERKALRAWGFPG
ncbi:hypothetical protein FKW77_005358 [Venturia effusa]|uniref:Uncharacterized protein n=1 Tax=Venturia effusa TaxID=50376 RepID=A0A517LP01_9PEZI|nr:hypothetical protein FKW77_005358 [Venturia effusa]